VEAFGNVAIEALACGVPVIAYRRGGPAEIVRDGETGFLVEPDRVTGLVEAIERLDKIDRYTCRQQAEEEYSLSAMGDRVEAWFDEIWRSRSLQ
jgi:UDP-glucose:tetrahydrobiopterin glucosyltransferase